MDPTQLLATVVYALLGMAVFGVAFLLVTKLTPFSVRHEIEEDHNTALAIVIGSMFLGLAVIIAASIAG